MEFVIEFIKIKNEETEDQTKWEFWLHKVFDKTWAEYLTLIEGGGTKQEDVLSQDELKATVMESREMLNGFCLS